ncbi:MAG: hypothetical protein V4709_12285 [Pseudomonadota bacterium]
MSDSSRLSQARESIASHIYVSSVYFVAVGVLYLWGFWSSFGINILEYVDLADIVKTTAYPITAVGVLVALGALLGSGLATGGSLPEGGGRNTRLGRLLNWLSPFLLASYIIGTALWILLGPVEKWKYLPVLLGVPVYVKARQARLLAETIPDDNFRSIVVFVLAILPATAYGQGALNAEKIRSGVAFTYSISQLPGYPAKSDALTQPRLIGRAGDHTFFFDPVQDAVLVAEIDADSALVLMRYKKPQAAGAALVP